MKIQTIQFNAMKLKILLLVRKIICLSIFFSKKEKVFPERATIDSMGFLKFSTFKEFAFETKSVIRFANVETIQMKSLG